MLPLVRAPRRRRGASMFGYAVVLGILAVLTGGATRLAYQALAAHDDALVIAHIESLIRARQEMVRLRPGPVRLTSACALVEEGEPDYGLERHFGNEVDYLFPEHAASCGYVGVGPSLDFPLAIWQPQHTTRSPTGVGWSNLPPNVESVVVLVARNRRNPVYYRFAGESNLSRFVIFSMMDGSTRLAADGSGRLVSSDVRWTRSSPSGFYVVFGSGDRSLTSRECRLLVSHDWRQHGSYIGVLPSLSDGKLPLRMVSTGVDVNRDRQLSSTYRFGLSGSVSVPDSDVAYAASGIFAAESAVGAVAPANRHHPYGRVRGLLDGSVWGSIHGGDSHLPRLDPDAVGGGADSLVDVCSDSDANPNRILVLAVSATRAEGVH